MSENPRLVRIAVQCQLLRGETQTLLDLVEVWGKETGRTTVEGVPIREWFFQRLLARLQTQLDVLRKVAPEQADVLEKTMQSIGGPIFP